jgi:hypothetical protein
MICGLYLIRLDYPLSSYIKHPLSTQIPSKGTHTQKGKFQLSSQNQFQNRMVRFSCFNPTREKKTNPLTSFTLLPKRATMGEALLPPLGDLRNEPWNFLPLL